LVISSLKFNLFFSYFATFDWLGSYDYFMNAREDQLKQFYGFQIFEMAQQTNQSWVVSKNQIAYAAPATMQEQVIIRTQLIHITDNVLVVEGIMLDQAGRRLKAAAWIEFTFINLQTGRSVAHPADFMDAFTPVAVADIFTPDGFNRRVDELKARFRKPASPAA
jgi:acyl-CoA thioester hydrolase